MIAFLHFMYISDVYTMDVPDFNNILGFQWDEGNKDKNWGKHAVSNSECEEIFFNTPFIVSYDRAHSGVEQRYYALGRTNTERYIFIVFTIRNDRIRVISAREMNRKERAIYENQEKSS